MLESYSLLHSITAKSDATLKMLRKRKLVEGRNSHLYVSKMVAKATNQEVSYTLTKGFDDAECIEWLRDFT